MSQCPEVQLIQAFKSDCTHKKACEFLQRYSNLCDVKALQDEDGQTLLHMACSTMTVQTVKLLVDEYGLDPSAQDKKGNTPLHLACASFNAKACGVLINDSACDPNIQNKDGETPTHLAFSCGHVSLGRLLLKNKRVDGSITNNRGETAGQIVHVNESKGEIVSINEYNQECIRESMQRTYIGASVSGFDIATAVVTKREYH